MTRVLIAESAWKTIVDEVNFFAADGNKEAALYPMFGFSRTQECLKTAWEMLGLEDIEYFVITHAHAPMRKFCFHTPVRAWFKFANDEEQNEHANDIKQWSTTLFAQHSMLEIGNVHSHPFSTIWTQPSSGGVYGDYYRMREMWRQMQKRMVDTPLEVILTRKFFGKKEWSACCFGFDSNQRVVSLGSAEIVRDDDLRVANVLAVPFILTPEGGEWKEKQFQQLSVLEAIDHYYFGWSTARVKIAENIFAFVHLSPQFQQGNEFLLQLANPETKQWTTMERVSFKSEAGNFSLFDIFNQFLQEVQGGK